MLFKLRVFVLFLMFMVVLGNTSILHADIFKIDEFMVIKNGATLFDDTFSDGAPPPAAPNYSNGTAASYGVNGTTAPETGGKLTLDTSLGEFGLNAPETYNTLTDQATLQTSRTAGRYSSLDSTSTFAVIGIFDLATPSDFGGLYRVRFSDNPGTGDANDLVWLGVFRRNDGNVAIQFRHNDNILNTTTLVDQILFNPGPGDDQIALRLSRNNASNNTITASFAYIDSGVFGVYHTFVNTTDIFNGEDFTRASFSAQERVVPEPCSMLLLIFGLAGIAGMRRMFSR